MTAFAPLSTAVTLLKQLDHLLTPGAIRGGFSDLTTAAKSADAIAKTALQNVDSLGVVPVKHAVDSAKLLNRAVEEHSLLFPRAATEHVTAAQALMKDFVTNIYGR